MTFGRHLSPQKTRRDRPHLCKTTFTHLCWDPDCLVQCLNSWVRLKSIGDGASSVFGTLWPSSKNTTCSFSCRFRGNPGIWAWHHANRISTQVIELTSVQHCQPIPSLNLGGEDTRPKFAIAPTSYRGPERWTLETAGEGAEWAPSKVPGKQLKNGKLSLGCKRKGSYSAKGGDSAF